MPLRYGGFCEAVGAPSAEAVLKTLWIFWSVRCVCSNLGQGTVIGWTHESSDCPLNVRILPHDRYVWTCSHSPKAEAKAPCVSRVSRVSSNHSRWCDRNSDKTSQQLQNSDIKHKQISVRTGSLVWGSCFFSFYLQNDASYWGLILNPSHRNLLLYLCISTAVCLVATCWVYFPLLNISTRKVPSQEKRKRGIRGEDQLPFEWMTLMFIY